MTHSASDDNNSLIPVAKGHKVKAALIRTNIRLEMMKNKEAEGDKLMKKAVNLCKPSLLELRVKPDWSASAPLYEQAMIAYKVNEWK